MLAVGDIAERVLRFFGITKERVQVVTGRRDCGCAKRQAAINEAGFRVQRAIGRTLTYRVLFPIHAFYRRIVVAGSLFRMGFCVLFTGNPGPPYRHTPVSRPR